MLRNPKGSVVAGLLTLCVAAPLSHAEWPMQRHNRHRTALTEGSSALERPTAKWRYYLGGRVSHHQLDASDVDGDGKVDVVYVSGGRVVVKRPFDAVVWESDPLGLTHIDRIVDMDKDGVLDIIALGRPGNLFILRGTDGKVQWRTDSSTFGPYLGALRYADFDGDGYTDIYLADNACGSIGQKGDVAVAFSFKNGFSPGYDDGKTQRLWQLERGREYNCGGNDVVADITGDGVPDIVAFAIQTIYLFDGKTGKKISATGYPIGFSIPFGVNKTSLADVDGDGRNEIVSFTNNSYTMDIRSRGVFVIDYDPQLPEPERLHCAWVNQVPDKSTDTHSFVAEGAFDLDGDGKAEVSTSFQEAGSWKTHIFEGASGAQKATLDGRLRAIYPPAANEKTALMLIEHKDTTRGYRVSSLTTPPTLAFTLPKKLLPWRSVDRKRSAHSSAVRPPLTLTVDQKQIAVLVEPGLGTLALWNLEGTAPKELARYQLPEHVVISAVAPQQNVAKPGVGLLLTRSDGYLVVLNTALEAINFYYSKNEFDDNALGIRTGGYYSGPFGMGDAPVAARLSASERRAEIVVRDSRGDLLRIDGRTATLVTPPKVAWRWYGAHQPLLLDLDADGRRDVVAIMDGTAIEARQADGKTRIFRNAGVASAKVVGDIVPFSAKSKISLVTSVQDSKDGMGHVRYHDSSGALLWQSTPVRTAGSGQGFVSADDLDQDGIDDVLIGLSSLLYLYNGKDGSQISAGWPSYPYMPINVRAWNMLATTVVSSAVVNTGGLVLNGTGFGDPVWSLESGDKSTYGVFGTVVGCEDTLHFVSATSTSAHVIQLDVNTGSKRRDIVLAKGQIFSDETTARAAGAWPGVVGNATATPALFGKKPAVLLGSTDGYLYALDPCAATPRLHWAKNLRAPVGEAIFADTDGDDKDEIIVTVADGFLYVLDTEVLPAPTAVIDLDPAMPDKKDDVDETHGWALRASWTAVPGATSYEYAVLTAGGTPITRNEQDGSPFLRTDQTTVSWSRQLTRGMRYVFAVRAIGSKGASGETMSDGTRFLADVKPAPPADFGPMPEQILDAGMPDASSPAVRASGGCQVAAPPPTGWPFWLLLAVLLLRRRVIARNHR